MKVTTKQVQQVLASVREQYHVSFDEQGPTVNTDYHESGPVVVWEGGPEEWTVHYSQSISAGLVKGAHGVFVEPVNHVVLGLYPA